MSNKWQDDLVPIGSLPIIKAIEKLKEVQDPYAQQLEGVINAITIEHLQRLNYKSKQELLQLPLYKFVDLIMTLK